MDKESFEIRVLGELRIQVCKLRIETATFWTND